MVDTNIAGLLVNKLKEAMPDFKTWANHHLSITETQSMIPIIEHNETKFPITTTVSPNNMSIEDKLRYYLEDLGKYDDAKANRIKSQIVQLLMIKNE